MIINTESVVSYNNNLRRTTDDMKLGVNDQVNQGTKKSSLKLMAGGPSKVNPPNSHPSNPIHKQAVQAQGLAPTDTQPTGEGVTPTPSPQAPAVAPPQAPTNTSPAQTPAPPQAPTNTSAVGTSVEAHHVNKALVAVGVLAFAGFVAWMR